jgi:dihydropteroate synthase
MERVLPVIHAVKNHVRIPISIDTRKSQVAEAAIREGAHILNDVSGLRYDSGMAEIAARYHVPVVLMHMRGIPKNMQKETDYQDLVGEVFRFFEEQIHFAEKSKIPKQKLVLDPGIGFGKKWQDNFLLLRHLSAFQKLGCPLLVGVSRKSFIGKALNLPETERLTGTLAAITAAVLYGAHIVRVHDVREAYQAVQIADQIRHSTESIQTLAA